MDATVRKKDVWMVGGAFLLSSSLLWLVLRSLLARGSLTQAKEKVWSHTSLKESVFAKGRRTSALPERSSQKSQPFSDQEKLNRLNKKNAEKTNVSHTQGNLRAANTRDKEENCTARNSTKTREQIEGRDILGPERLKRQEDDDKKVPVEENEHLVFKEEKNGTSSEEETSRRETEKIRALAVVKEQELDECWKRKQDGGHTNGDSVQERCLESVPAISTSRTPGNPAQGTCFQHHEPTEPASHSKRRGTEESTSKEDTKKSKTDVTSQGTQEPSPGHEGLQDQSPGSPGKTSAVQALGIPLDDAPAPPAPFPHRIVTAKKTAISSFYIVNRSEILGGGRFGQVHKCEEKATGLKLAAKIIKTRTAKDKDEVQNEINIMNQLDHVNLIQLYDAFESKNSSVLVMEYLDGGELFDRIIDDNYQLTELDAIVFIRQICEGVRHMHQMYILHLDLKPENILCVNRDAKQIKIIDFGLARRYKPREKLKVNFGTPEFLAPEIVNYDFVSFPTDMWNVGVITYMLLSGLSPFLGDNDTETLNNILDCRWDLEEEEFRGLSAEGREFISKLLTKEKNWRIGASEALKHPWLSDQQLHSKLSTQKQKLRTGEPDSTDK